MTILSSIVESYNNEIAAINAEYKALQARRAALAKSIATEATSVVLRLRVIEMDEVNVVVKHPMFTVVVIFVALVVSFWLGTLVH